VGTQDRLASIIERIEALNQRMEELMRTPSLDPDTLGRMAYLHAEWKETLAANVAAMDQLSDFLRRVDPNKPPVDKEPPRSGDAG